MEIPQLVKNNISNSFFFDMPEAPISVFFLPTALMIGYYKYLRDDYLYNITDYYQNPKGEIMVKLLELDHWIKFTPGGVMISNYIVQN